MADKNFGVRRVELIGSSGTPNITSPNNLNLNANTVAISTDLTIGGQVNSDIIVAIGQSVGIGSTQPTGPLDVKGTINADYFDIENFNVTGILTASNVDLGTSTLDNLNVSGVSTFQGNVNLGDNDALYLGDNQDLSIYHDGASGISWIQETGEGDLRLATNSSVAIQNTTGTAKTSAQFNPDGAVELYYDNSKKFETTGAGGTVFGTLETQQLNVTGVSTFNNNIDMEGDIIFGTQGDKLIFTSSNFPASGGSIEIATEGANYATIAGNSKQLRIFNDTDNTYSIDMRAGKYSWKDENADYYALYSDGSVKLYHPGTSGGILEQKFETTHYGAGIAGTLTVDNNLDVTGVITATTATFTGTGAVGLNTGTTAQRPASPDAGMIRYNSENEQFEGYSSSWGSLGGASGSGGDAVFYENDNTVTTSYTITSGKNAMSAGPITIGAGATVTIPAGSVWTIV